LQKKTLTVAEIADIVGGQIIGDADILISRVSSLDQATDQDISFLSNPKLEQQLNTTQAGCVLLSVGYAKQPATTCILCKDPYLAFALVAQALDITPLPASEISPAANIHPSVVLEDKVKIAAGAVLEKDCRIGNNVSIGANTYLGEGVIVGDNTIVYANVSIYHRVTIGASCILHSGAVIGCDGFGYANDGGSWVKIPQTGGVIIQDKVEIGANACVDRGALNDTIIRKGVKIDNLCHIAHNVEVGENTAMAAFTGIAGSAKIGKSCTFSGRSSIIGHLNIAEGTHLTAGTLVNKSNETAGVFSSGTGAQENKIWRKNVARFKQLDDMAKKLRLLEKKIKDLQGD
jgi:UDP-3-O-[3-hydroxymyristoyl] glucosamine N-acyltransferase